MTKEWQLPKTEAKRNFQRGHMADCSDGFMNIHISLSSSNYPVKLYTLNMSSVSYISCDLLRLSFFIQHNSLDIHPCYGVYQWLSLFYCWIIVHIMDYDTLLNHSPIDAYFSCLCFGCFLIVLSFVSRFHFLVFLCITWTFFRISFPFIYRFF